MTASRPSTYVRSPQTPISRPIATASVIAAIEVAWSARSSVNSASWVSAIATPHCSPSARSSASPARQLSSAPSSLPSDWA